jgi:anthranilate phosphoribosyltransferase
MTGAAMRAATNPAVTEAIDLIASGTDLTVEQAQQVLREIMSDAVGEAQTAAFLVALRTKGETVDELTGLARTMREMAVPVEVGGDDLLDTAGTGGGASTFNVSTIAAFVAAGAGCRVAKHGNRSATSLCGSADLLEALGARIDLEPEAVAECIEEIGFGFMFAPLHHGATRHVVPVRKALGVRTIFNFLGPLTNPAGASRQLIGVSDPSYLELMAGALVQLGSGHALLVSSEDGLDEISVGAETKAVELTADGVNYYMIDPVKLGVETAEVEALAGGAPEQNAEIARSVLGGESGPRRALIAINAGAALLVAGRAGNLEDGVRLAERTIDSGAALEAMERFVAKSSALAPEA